MNDIELQEIGEKIVELSLSRAEHHFGEAYILPSVSLCQRGKIAGSAHLQKNMIKLNKKLFIQNQEAFAQQVIPHEVAHIVCFQKFGKVKPHGKEWQAIMRLVFNLDAEVTHKFNVANVGMQEFAYKCVCNTVMLSAIRHNKVQRGKQQYRCQKCKEVLEAC